MAADFPTTLADFTEISCSDRMDDSASSKSGVQIITDLQEELAAVQAKVGINSSAVTSTLDYKLTNISSSNPGHKHTLANGATDVTASAAEVNIMDGVTASTAELNYNDSTFTAGYPIRMNSAGTAFETFEDTHSLARQGLINSDFKVWQRGTSFTPNDDVYIADRWNALVETNGSWTFARDTDVPTNSGALYSLKCSNVTLNNQCAVVQIIESINAKEFIGKTASLSFYAKTNSTEIANLRATILSWSSTADVVTSDVIGTWASDGTDPTFATNWTKEVAGSNLALTSSWQLFKIENITIDTANTTNIAVIIWVDDGTIAANDDFYLTKVQLNVGATVLPHQGQSYNTELIACRRYCRALSNSETAYMIGNGSAATSTIALIFVPLSVQLRSNPSITATASDWQLDDGVTATDLSAISIQSNRNGNDSVCIRCTVSSGLTAFRPYQLIADGNASRLLILESEI